MASRVAVRKTGTTNGTKVVRGAFDVFVTRIGEEPTVHQMTPGSTVKDCLEKAGIDVEAEDLRLDAKPTTMTSRVSSKQVISIVGNVEGGCNN